MNDSKIAIVGGGITGLAASKIFKKKDISFEIFEKKDEPGGALKTVQNKGWMLEYGPNTLLLKDKIVADFIDDLGISNEMISANESASKRFIVKNGRLEPLPASILNAVSTPLFSFNGKLRILKEPFISRSENKDQTVAQFVERRLGEEVLQYAINPFVAGIFANNPESLSLRHAFPAMHNLEAEYGSLIWGMFAGAKKRKEIGRIARKLISFTNGIQQLPKALAEYADNIHCNQKVEKVEKKGKDWFVLSNGQEFGPYSKVIINIPLYQITENLLSLSENELYTFRKVNYPPLSVMHLGYKKEDVQHPLDGFGFLVPEVENRKILGALFSSTLFDGRAPNGHHLLTVFIGGGRQPDLAPLETEKMLSTVQQELNELIGAGADPVFVDHVYWPNSIPAYHIGYDEILTTFKNIEVKNPGLHLAGNFRNGISVPDCIKNGIDLAEKISESMNVQN
jgi:protoporphyrinogen/coproporphyrinogen III oxidase